MPALIVAGSILAAHGLVEAGGRIPALSRSELPSILAFGAEESRALLSAIATATITVAGVAFSITIVTLSLASTQYSPRVLRQFMRDRANQAVLGVFVGIFAYCLILLLRMRSGGDAALVPTAAVAFAVTYALAGVGCLLFFIHHVATSIQASCIVSEIAAETRVVADRLFPAALHDDGDEASDTELAEDAQNVTAPASGYLQLLDEDDLLKIAVECDLVIRVERAVGDFVIAGLPIATVDGRGLDAALARKIAAAFTIDHTRTVEQDVMFGVRQIVDIALRALSPSLNDPTTAILCVDYLTTIVHRLAGRRMSSSRRRHDGRLRTLWHPPGFDALVAVAYGEIRRNATSHLTVFSAIARGLATVEAATTHASRRAILAAEAAALQRALGGENDSDTGGLRREIERLKARLA